MKSKPVTPPPPRERFVPSWYERASTALHHRSTCPSNWIEYAQAGRLRLPIFQRPWKWSDEQIARLFDSFIGNYHVGELLIWERRDLSVLRQTIGEIEVVSGGPRNEVWLIVDGQQRIGALLTMALSGRFWINVLEGALVTAPGPWCFPAAMMMTNVGVDFFNAIDPHAKEHGLPRQDVFDAMSAMYSQIQRVQIHSVMMGGVGDWTLERVMESYRRLATCGTPMDPGDVEEGLRRAIESGDV